MTQATKRRSDEATETGLRASAAGDRPNIAPSVASSLRRSVAVINGVRIIPLQRIPDERGTVMHMLRRDDEHFLGFGEIYFSTIYRDAIKGWHRHREMTLNYACISGRIKLVLFDDRPASPTCGALMEQFLGPDHYALVQVPPGVWNGFKGMSDPCAIVANCCTHPHDPAAGRTDRLDPLTGGIPYDWNLRCC